MTRIAGRPPDWTIERARETVHRATRADASLEDVIRGHLELEALEDLGFSHGLSAAEAAALRGRRNDLVHLARTGLASRAKPPPSYMYRLTSWLRPSSVSRDSGALAASWLELVSRALPAEARDEHVGDALEGLHQLRERGAGRLGVSLALASWTVGMLRAAARRVWSQVLRSS